VSEWGRITGGPVIREGFIPGRYPPRTYAEVEDGRARCLCGDDDPDGCVYLNCGYEYCPACNEHHRPPVCVPVIEGTVTDFAIVDGLDHAPVSLYGGNCDVCGLQVDGRTAANGVPAQRAAVVHHVENVEDKHAKAEAEAEARWRGE
jgi:hypothetical protein